VEVVPDCGHLVVLDQREALHEAILGFLSERSHEE
jgi:pimeloyl-ACP methyl ester carboxylesterase